MKFLSKLGHLIQLGLDEMKNDPPDYFLYSAFVQISSSGSKERTKYEFSSGIASSVYS